MKQTKNKGATTVGITLLMTSGLMASALGVRQINDGESKDIWVLNKNVPAGQVITIKDISQQELSGDLLKTAALSVQNPRAIIGKKLANTKYKDEMLFSSDFVRVKAKALSEAIPAGRVLYTLKLPNLDIPISRLHKGDRLDIVAKSGRSVRTVARDVQLIGVSKQPGSQSKNSGVIDALSSKSGGAQSVTSLVLAVMPKNVYSLAGIDSSDRVSVIVHSAFDIEQGKLQDFTRLQTTRTVEVVKGVKKESVFVAR